MEKVLIDTKEFGRVILDFIGSDEFNDLITNCEDGNADFKRGAMWGMAMASIKAFTECTQYSVLVTKDESDM